MFSFDYFESEYSGKTDGTKNVQFSNASRSYSYQAKNNKFCEMIAIYLLNSKM